jgi:hypothetical protein
LAEQYDSCTTEIEAFNRALESNKTELAASAGATLEASIMAGEFAQ